MPDVQTLPLSAIQTAGLQVRIETNRQHVDDLVELFGDASEWPDALPPIVVFGAELGPFFVGDGHHRLHAAQEAGCTSIPCEVYAGDKTAALWYACGANSAHGLRRTAEDRRNAILTAHRLDPQMSNCEIARRCRVSEGLVRYHLAQDKKTTPPHFANCGVENEVNPLSDSDSGEDTPSTPTPYYRVDARGRLMDVSRIGKARPRVEGVVVDALDIPLTPATAPAFKTAIEVDEIVKLLREAQRRIAAISTEPGAELLRANALKCEKRGGEGERYHSADVQNAISELQHWQPWSSVCPACRGGERKNECKVCLGLPYTTESAFGRCTAAQQEAVRAMASPGLKGGEKTANEVDLDHPID